MKKGRPEIKGRDLVYIYIYIRPQFLSNHKTAAHAADISRDCVQYILYLPLPASLQQCPANSSVSMLLPLSCAH